ncbi:MAG: hypothetical protein L0G94_11150 [Brachybacterium sp.]|uniref:hypothetical protein n=1 Tax=Brachybacterium sp. TaxID=1891286 RepID=UPI0026483A6E|nr:hypothetical protein [Brachybacterium sp.]MDN5687213.1 hypothetical protein [Brachybacterium sp.]
MAKLMTVDNLTKIADSAGIPLVPSSPIECDLYVIADREGNCLYVGQSASQEGGRVLYEISLRHKDPTTTIHSGIVALMVENDGVHHTWQYDHDSFDSSRLDKAISEEHWEGGAVDTVQQRLDSRNPPTLDEVEEFLIRAHVRTGCLIANSQHSSQWEGPIGRFADTAAALAVDAARLSGDIDASNFPYLGDLDAQKDQP